MLPVFINKDTRACATLTAGSQYHPCGRSPFGSITRHVGDMWLLLDVKLPLAGALQLLPDHIWIASECPTQRCVFAGSAGYSCQVLAVLPKKIL